MDLKWDNVPDELWNEIPNMIDAICSNESNLGKFFLFCGLSLTDPSGFFFWSSLKYFLMNYSQVKLYLKIY